MDGQALVAYATTHCSTEETANKIGQVHCDNGLTAEVVPVSQIDGELQLGAPETVLDDPMWVNVGGYSYWPDPGTGGFFILRDNQPPTTRELRVVEGWRSIR